MKIVAFPLLAGICTLVMLLPAVALSQATPPPAVAYTDGAIAQAERECGLADLCATITLPDKDVLRLYNQSSGRCEAFTLRLDRMHGDVVIMSSDLSTSVRGGGVTYNANSNEYNGTINTYGAAHNKCARFKNTYFTLDSGQIQMGVFLAKDGALFVEFTPPKPQ